MSTTTDRNRSLKIVGLKATIAPREEDDNIK